MGVLSGGHWLNLISSDSPKNLWVVDRLKGRSDVSERTSSQRTNQTPSPLNQARTNGLLGSLDEIVAGNMKPPYPPVARRLKLHGTGIIETKISPAGKVKQIIFKQTTGHIMLDQAITRTVKKWKIPNKSHNDFWLTLPPFEFKLSSIKKRRED